MNTHEKNPKQDLKQKFRKILQVTGARLKLSHPIAIHSVQWDKENQKQSKRVLEKSISSVNYLDAFTVNNLRNQYNIRNNTTSDGIAAKTYFWSASKNIKVFKDS